jgi:type I restriction enzyme M protein
MHEQESVNKIYDPTCGSGSLLMQAKSYFDSGVLTDGFFGQEINPTSYNLARMNMFLHNISYDKFKIEQGNTLTAPKFGDDDLFDAIVSNPPYSTKWPGADDSRLARDYRFEPAKVLAPKSKADLAFVMHCLSYLSDKGRAAIVCFPGIFYRGGAEQKIRQYLIEKNYVETLIALPPDLFVGTSIAVNVLILSKSKPDTSVQFIDASGPKFFERADKNNYLRESHIAKILDLFAQKKNVDHVAQNVPCEQIASNDYNLSVSAYVDARDDSEIIDIDQLNSEIENLVIENDKIRAQIKSVIAEFDA